MSEVVTLMVGDNAPDFEAPLTDGSKFVLSEVLDSGKGVILYFYPRDNTPGCTSQACDFRDNFNRISNNSWIVVGVSTDSAKSHEKFIDKHDLPFDLIVDEDAELHTCMEHGERRACMERHTWALSDRHSRSLKKANYPGLDTKSRQRATLIS